jgi:hypothetical protein
MSPEQARGRSVDFRSDIYSLGVVLFEMLAGARPFEGQSPVEVIAHHLHDPLPALRDRRRDLSPEVVALVEDMTAKEPERRPSSYKALLQRIEGSAYVDASQASTSMPTSTMPSLRRPARRRVVVGLTSLALATALGSWWARGRSIPPAPAGSLAVVAFYGPDEASAREGRMLAALVEAELGRRLRDNLRVVGVDDAGPPIRSESGARALAGRLRVDGVVWGQSLSLGPRVEAQPWLTSARSSQTLTLVSIESDEGKGALERRRAAAQALSDAVLLAAARDALETRPEAALLLAQQAGTSTETVALAAEARQRAAPRSP